jgi:hypothetical protein
MEAQHTSQSTSEGVQNIQQAGRALYSKAERLPAEIFLSGAAASIALSLFLRITGRQHDAQFVGQWAPTLLLLGLYTREGRRFRSSSNQLDVGREGVGREMH